MGWFALLLRSIILNLLCTKPMFTDSFSLIKYPSESGPQDSKFEVFARRNSLISFFWRSQLNLQFRT